MHFRLAPFALLWVSAFWGAAFVLMKDALTRQDVTSFLFTRFALATIVLLLLKPRVINYFSKDLVLKGVAAGCFLAAGFLLQTFGLEKTTAAITGFITGLYVVTTPLIAAVFLRQKISGRTWVYVGIATSGLALLSIQGWQIGIGELLVLASALAYSFHIIALSEWSSGLDAYALTVVQLATCAGLCGIGSLKAGYQAPPDNRVWGVVIFTAIFASAIAFIIQTWSQAHLSATRVAVILTMEMVFAAFFAVIFGGEVLTLQLSIGGALVVAAILLIVLQDA